MMGESAKDLRSIIQTSFIPVVLVLSTAGADKLCQKSKYNGRFIDVIKWGLGNTPGGTERKKLTLKFSESSYDINDFRIRFMELWQLEKQVDETQHASALGNMVDESIPSENYADIKITCKADVPLFQRAYKDSTPWYDRYKYEYIRSIGSSEHEFFYHPVACVLIASADEPNPIASLVKLYDPAKPPSIFQEGRGDVYLPKMYALLHTDEFNLPNSEKRVLEMKNTFGNFCTIIKLDEDESKGPNLPSSNSGSGMLNNTISIKTLGGFVNDVIYKGAFPYIEKAVADLSDLVVANKKGLFHKIRSFRLGGSSNTPPPNTPKGRDDENVLYSSGTTETATRRLADLLFMAQDYETALAHYRNCSKDFNNEKQQNFFAATQEMIGICLFLLGRDVESYLDNAYLYYQRSGRDRFAMRSTFFYGDILKMRGNFKTASEIYSRATERDMDPFCAAILQEQAAFCYVFMNPPMLRKFSFRLVMAGERFADINKKKHALRCYEWAYSVYQGRNWSMVDDHLHLSLVRFSSSLGRVDQSIQYIKKLLEKNQQSFQRQNSIVREYLYNCQANSTSNSTDPFPITPVPIINNETVRVYLNDYSPVGDEDVWKEMEEAFRSESEITLGKSGNIRQGFDLWKAKEEESNNKAKISVVEELIYVEAVIYNPLAVPLQFNFMHLVGTFEKTQNSSPSSWTSEDEILCKDEKEEEKEENGNENVNIENNQKTKKTLSELGSLANEALSAFAQRRGIQGFRIEPFDVLLGPSEFKKVTFSIQPLREGFLEVKGIGLCMCGAIWGKRDFNLKKKRLNRTQQQRKTVSYEPNFSLSVRVTAPMPRLEVNFVEFPEQIIHGEVRRAGLMLRNCSSKTGLKKVKVRMTHPAFVCIGQEDYTRQNILNSGNTNIKFSNLSVPIDVSLGPGSTVTVPIWIIGRTVGTFTLHFLFYYESEVGNTEMKYRLTRCQSNIKVLPSIRVSTFTQQSATDLNAYLLGIEMENADPNMVFSLHQMSAVSETWKVEALSNSKTSSKELYSVAARQSVSIFFRLQRVSDSEIFDGKLSNQNYRRINSQIYSDLVFDPKRQPIDSSAHPQFTLLQKEKSLLLDIKAQSQPIINAPPPKEKSLAFTKEKFPENLNSDDHINKIDLMLFWEAISNSPNTPNANTNGAIFGLHNIPLVSFMPLHNTDPMLASPWGTTRRVPLLSLTRVGAVELVSVPLRFQIESPSHVSHKFQNNVQSLCTVPIKLHVANCSSFTPLNFDFMALMPHEHADPEYGRAMYLWSGVTTYQNISLEPQSQATLDLQICFFQPGMYNLNRFKFTVRGHNTTRDVFPPFQHLIAVDEVRENSTDR